MFMAFNMGWIIFWGIAYVLIVRRGFIDKTFGYPFIAICVDIAWVTTFTLIYPQSPFMLLFVIVDLIFLYQLLKFRTSDLTNLSKGQYYTAIILAIVTSFALIIAFSIEFNDVHGVYSSFVDTLLTSILFIVLILRRDNVKGQSIYIAISKMLGTFIGRYRLQFLHLPRYPPAHGDPHLSRGVQHSPGAVPNGRAQLHRLHLARRPGHQHLRLRHHLHCIGL